MSQATDDPNTSAPSNVIAFPRLVDDESPSDLEVRVAIMEEHLASMEKAVLIMAHGVERQRALLSEIKAAAGWRWTVPESSALFGDAVLFAECAVRVVPK